jgi:uncharacterized membrane protein
MSETSAGTTEKTAVTPAILAAVAALFGLADSAYLTAKHYTDKNVPCSLITGCEQVLKSEYAEMFGLPTAAYGAFAYFLAFSLAILTVYGNPKTWNLFGALTLIMTVFTVWLLYLQAFVINAFCQFCLLSAATSFTLFIIFLISKIWYSLADL